MVERERNHFANLQDREAVLSNFISTQSKHYLGQPQLGTTANDDRQRSHHRQRLPENILGRTPQYFGGEVRSFESLLERARREALLRIIEEAQANGYNAICNLRMETAEIGGNLNRKKGTAMASVLASATAYRTNF